MVAILGVLDFGGRMHPVLVHLPIGILMLVSLYYVFAGAAARFSQSQLVGTALFWGMLSAIGACISGLLLAGSGDYEAAAVAQHKWLGIVVAVVSVISYVLHKIQYQHLRWLMISLVLLITVTGHLGGSITHGENYLTEPFGKEGEGGTLVRKPIPDIQQAFVYNDIIKPILSTKCYSCHGVSKQKGKLRLDEPDYIIKGGKEGAAVVWDHADKSAMIERILLPETDEDHMPPKEKPQLTKSEMALLQWWVNSGAGFDKKVHQAKGMEKVKLALHELQTGNETQVAKTTLVPEKEVGQADDKAVQALKANGAVVIPVAANSNYLSVNFVSAEKTGADQIKQLEALKDQLVWLKLGHAGLKDTDMPFLGKLAGLRRLHVGQNKITDAGIKHLARLKELQYLNLSETGVSQKGLETLHELKKLERIYLYRVAGQVFDLPALKKIFPAALIDTGGYKVPTLEGDTTLFTKTAPM